MVGRLINKLVPTTSAISNVIKSNRIVVFSKTFCPFCAKAIELLNKLNKDYANIELDKIENGNRIQTTLYNLTGQRTVPSVFFSGSHIGGYSDLLECYEKNQLEIFEKNAEEIQQLRLTKQDHEYDYDLAVIGGGSGGLACAQKAASYGAKVIIYDYVKPTPHGAVWGIGGTCVNVGCVPKKLFHQAAIIGENIEHCTSYGWQNTTKTTHNWSELVENIQNHIKSINFYYRRQLKKENITYLNQCAVITDKHTINSVDNNGVETKITSKFIVLATGERPIYPNIEGDKECCITSDDMFSLQYPPGKTLVIGASYVALECAGFLNALGYDTTVMVRSILLRGFDQQMANKVGDHMESLGIKFFKQCIPQKFKLLEPIDLEKKKPGLIEVTYKDQNGTYHTGKYNTVLLAIGRQPIVRDTNADKLGVQLDSKVRVVGIAGTEMTHVGNIFAIGDILAEKPQLTPMAVQSGNLLASRLFGDDIYDRCDYSNVATTVFTPLEYGCIGLSEDDATKKFGDDVDVLHNYVHYLENAIIEGSNPADYYAKLIIRPSLNDKVIGFHIVAPNAGEITQGFALGFRMGATLKDYNSIIGIHPTCAEVFTSLTESKKQGKKIQATGC